MESAEDRLQSLVQRVEKRERTVFRRTVLLSLIPVIVAVLLLVYIGGQIRQSYQQLQDTNEQLSNTNAQLQSLQQELKTMQSELAKAQTDVQSSQKELQTSQKELQTATDQLAQKQRELANAQAEIERLKQQIKKTTQELDREQGLLQEATSLEPYRYHSISPAATKYLLYFYSDVDNQNMMVDILVQSRKIPWKLNGTSPVEGFDSPGYAAYVLTKNHRGLHHIPVNPTQDELRQHLKPVGSPDVGDIVFYETGYTMFYLMDEHNDPFVMGMTPFGVIALKPDFARVLGYASH